MKSAILNDVHFGARHDNADIARQQKLFFEDQFFPYCVTNNIKNVFCFGDFYDDRRHLSVRSLKASRKMFLEPLRDLGMKMTIIPGNHDLEYKNSFDLNSLKEGLGYFTSTVDIIDSPKEVVYGNIKVLWLPWINDENLNKTLQMIERSDADTVFAHLELNGFETSPGIESRHTNEMITAQHLKKFGSVFTGHYHHKSKHGNIEYLGAQYQMTWVDVNSNKYFHIWDNDNPHVMEAVKNPISLYRHYHYDDTKNTTISALTKDIGNIKDKHIKVFVLNRSNIKLFDTFINQLNAHSGALSIDVIEKEFANTAIINESTETEEVDQQELASSIIETEHLVDEYIDDILDNNTDYNGIALKTIARQILLEAKELA